MVFISGSLSSDRALPLQRLIEATMRGNAEAQAQSQVKDVASKQMAANQKLSVTMTANPSDPGNPLLHIKNATADQVNQTQESDLQKTYDAPHQNVENQISKMNQAPNAGDFESHALQSVGYQPEPTNKTAADLSGIREDYRAQRDMGENVGDAAMYAIGTRLGLFNKAKIAEDLNRTSAIKNAAAFKTAAEPVIQEQDRQRRMDLATTKQDELDKYRLQQEGIGQQKALDAKALSAIKSTDYTLMEPGSEIQDLADQIGVDPEQARRYGGVIGRTRRQQIDKENAQHFADWTGKSGMETLGMFATAADAKKSYGRALDPEQEAQFNATWKVARQDRIDKQRARDIADQRLSIAEKRLSMAETGKPEKPVKLRKSDYIDSSSDRLAALRGDERFDQTSVEQAIEERRGRITQQLSDLDAKMKGNATEHAKLAPMVYDKAGKIQEGVEQSNPFIFTRVVDAENKGRMWATQAATLKGELAKLGGVAPSQAPKIGDTKKFPNGNIGKFDGNGWVLVGK